MARLFRTGRVPGTGRVRRTGRGFRTGGGFRTGRGAGIDRGASSMEWALLTPILLIVIMVVIQFTLVYHARQVALAAAQSGARTARTQVTGDWERAAEAKARADVAQIGPKLITPLNVDANGDANERWVEVSGSAASVVPFMTFRVHERSGGPVECFRPDVGTGTDCEPR